MTVLFVVLMLLAFVVMDILVRILSQRIREASARQERLAALDVGLNLDFTHEAKSLKRVDVPNPLARILGVDDEPVVLDSFRKILVVAGYAIDTVESGREALGLVQKRPYDFVFTDLKMPEMDGLDVVKGVKHFSPETDVIVITGYATIESAVNAMKFGAMDYVQKPFTEDELVDFTKKCLFRRQDRLEKQIRPTVHVVTAEQSPAHEFALPGGVFISEGHVWVSVSVPGLVWVGIDDFARKMIGRIDAVEFPSKGSQVRKGERVFAIRQGERTVSFRTPISGRIHAVNAELAQNLAWLEKRPYEKGWICSIKPDQLALELESLRIGERAADWYQQEIKRARELLTPARSNDQGRYPAGPPTTAQLVEGQLQEVDEQTWDHFTRGFFSV